jgi:hypothetical protein
MNETPTVIQMGKKDDVRASLELLKRELPNFIEHASLIAKFKHAYFVALVGEGFTHEQALELCKHSSTL